MRSGKSLAVLVLLFGGLLAYLYFVDAEKPLSTGVEEKPKAFSLEADKIEELRVSTVAGDDTTLRKADGVWQITAPVQTRADESEVSSITSNLANLEIQRVVDEKPADLGDYGLKDPRVEIAFRTEGEQSFRTLQLGNKTPTGADMYAKLGDDPKVFLVLGYVESSFNRAPFDLRDKKILSFDRDQLDRIELAHGGTTIEIVKKGNDWRLAKPVDARADFSAVEGLVTRLQSAQMKAVEADSAENLRQYGLADPGLVATLGAGSTRASLAIGSAAPSTDLFARDLSRPMVFTVAPDLRTDLAKTVDDLRNRDVFEFRAYNATRIELVRDGKTHAFELVKGEGDTPTESWRRVSPEPAGEADLQKVTTLLSRLGGLRAEGFPAPKTVTGLDSPVLRVTAKFDEGKKEETVAFGRSGEAVYASRAGEPGAMTVTAASFDDVLKALDDLQ